MPGVWSAVGGAGIGRRHGAALVVPALRRCLGVEGGDSMTRWTRCGSCGRRVRLDQLGGWPLRCARCCGPASSAGVQQAGGAGRLPAERAAGRVKGREDQDTISVVVVARVGEAVAASCRCCGADCSVVGQRIDSAGYAVRCSVCGAVLGWLPGVRLGGAA